MIEPVFIDTNILVYAYDTHEEKKQETAQRLLKSGINNGNLHVSAQVFGEFFIAITKRIKNPMTTEEALTVINGFTFLHTAVLDRFTVLRAIQLHIQYRLSYWDCLIISSAEQTGCTAVMTEDLNDGQVYAGVKARNPFKD